MIRRNLRPYLNYTLAVLTFVIISLYTYARLVDVPFVGFEVNMPGGIVTEVMVEAPQQDPTLQVGDRLIAIGGFNLAGFQDRPNQPLFPKVQPGGTLPLTVQRDGQQFQLDWTVPGATPRQIVNRLISLWWFAYVFWIAGIATIAFLRPVDIRWQLLTLFFFLTAIWLAAGIVSAYHLWYSSTVMRIAIWLCVPVYLHLHWVFPWSLGRISPLVWISIYILGIAFALSEIFAPPIPNAYLMAIMIAVTSSLGLLAAHAWFYPERRADLGLMLLALSVILLPNIAVAIALVFNRTFRFSDAALITLPVVPGAYFYTIYRRQLGGLELRANRVLTILLYGVLLFTASTLIISVSSLLSQSENALIPLAIGSSLLIGLLTARYYPDFQRWVETHLLGMPHPPTGLLETYTSRISTSLELESLAHLLQDEIFASLLIRQAALIRLENNEFGGQDDQLSVILRMGINEDELPNVEQLPDLLTEAGELRRIPAQTDASLPCPWVRLALALRVDKQPMGVCLLGKRSPDDHYAPSEIQTLQALMDQTALALINIDQAKHLRGLYQSNIERQEIERNRLALDLHDDVLGQMAMLSMSVDERIAGEQFTKAYQASVQRVREIISGLRPGMLNYGLRPALTELIDDVASQATPPDREEPDIDIQIELPPSPYRYPPDVELHLYRIIQQACQNVLKHASASSLILRGSLDEHSVYLEVCDDGIGFAAGQQLDLAWLLANQHFGLAGMHERAALIGAQVRVNSSPGNGTIVSVTWKSPANDKIA